MEMMILMNIKDGDMFRYDYIIFFNAAYIYFK